MSDEPKDVERPAGLRADGYNAGFAEQLAEREMRERGVVPPSLSEVSGDGGAPPSPAPERAAAARVPEDQLRVAAAAGSLVAAYRDHGHLAARLDPLDRREPQIHPLLQPSTYGIDEEQLEGVPASLVDLGHLGDTLADALGRLREIYCGPLGYELDQLDDPAKRDWLVERIEGDAYRDPLDGPEAVEVLERLSQVEGMERFLHRAYLGKKRFSIEGLDMMVPMLDEALQRGAEAGVREVVLGMAHRGRLNVLAHIIGRPYRAILAEFEGEHDQGVSTMVPEEGAGDVKYHLGAAGVVETGAGPVDVYLAPNPSHLEHVNPVVEGMARAARDLRNRGERGRGNGPGGRQSVLPVLIHGDAAFMGEGVVAETLNLSDLAAYETGGTVHLIANNQLGFTTEPGQGRSTRYASDLALAFRIPVVHVNADDPEACLAAIRLAFDFRREFGHDIVVDLVGYRRHGHNEGDEPAYTQPALYDVIDDHPTVREQWERELTERGVIDADRAGALQDEVSERLTEARSSLSEGEDEDDEPAEVGDARERALRAGLTELTEAEEGTETAVAEDRLRELHEAMLTWPDGLDPLDKLADQMEKRRASLEEGEPLDWARGEMLAFATLVTEGTPVRLTGEDAERGTFSQRHLVLHDESGEESWTPLEHLPGMEAPFEVHNTPLSEVATLGFEYGYSTIATEALVAWEAQFGDFANVGQAIFDQFIAAGRSKWGQESRLVMLLPHGHEGQGPEHSSARPERYLQLCAEGNLRVAYPTTPAQHFHLLRLQALRPDRRPLVVMTPKSLLRHPRARSPLSELAGGGFRPVIGDPERGDADRVLLCSGKVYYDLVGSDDREEHPETAVLRVERLYPFPGEELERVLDAHGSPDRVAWVQEEPRNMGAWRHVEPYLRELLPDAADLRYVGRRPMASPAEGYKREHEEEQLRIVREAFGAGG